MHHHLKAYLITHPYLDHVEGLVVISPNDTAKPIFGTEGVLNDMQNHLFNGRIWPNLCNTGTAPALGQYTYMVLKHGEATPIHGTQMYVSAFPLAHGNNTDSTAFLIESRGDYILYMGDTGPDEVEKRMTTRHLWDQMAPLVRSGKMRGIFIETSYPDERPDTMLFSHLTPAWLMHSFRKLADLVDSNNPKKALSGLNVIITHIKPDLTSHRTPNEIIQDQLRSHNDLGLNLIFAEQGKPIAL
jgi:cAMP phosphodiesterase